ncbi:MAG: site-2 protease family protein [Candidatus Aenigmarchaeota archaeon]|nr:site-2 protease family protein [Candidatus Aenigmarchaeota archaeon]
MDKTELRDILVAWMALSVAFMIATRKISVEYLFIFLFIIAVSFLTHEFAHRQVAKRLGYDAKFEMWPFGLLLAILSSLGGFIFAAPGAVVIYQKRIVHESRKKIADANFKIAVAGPLSNIILSIVFLILSITFRMELFYLAAYINALLAVFNLLPIPPLDGSKVFQYNSKTWLPVFLIALGLYLML